MNTEDIKKIFEGADLSDEIMAKMAEIFEARIEEEKKLINIQLEEEIEAKYSTISEDYSAYLVAEMEEKTENYITEELVPSIDKYVEFAIDEFMKENKQIVESNVKVELADNFLTGFSGLTESYNVLIPEGKDDQVEKLSSKLDEANKTIDTLLTSNKELKDSIIKESSIKIINSVSNEMTETQKEKFNESCSKIEFIDEDQFTNAVMSLKESFVPVMDKEETVITEKLITEDEDIESDDKYLSELLSRV